MRSQCCNAELIVDEGDARELTRFYVCIECGRPSDPRPDPRQAGLFGDAPATFDSSAFDPRPR